MTKEIENTKENEELKAKIEKMKLSEIYTRLEEIKVILKSSNNEAIDQMIPLLTESNFLKDRADLMIGDIESYLSEY